MVQTIYDGETAQDVENQPAAEVKHPRVYKALATIGLVGFIGSLGAFGGYVFGGLNEKRWHCPSAEQTDVMAPGSQVSFDNPDTAAKPDLTLTNSDGRLIPEGLLAPGLS